MTVKNYQKIHPTLAWGMCLIGAMFYSYEYLLRVAPSVMLPYLMNLYQINAKEVGVLSAYYFYMYTPLQIVVGTLFDRFGVRLLLIIATLGCALGSWFFGFYDAFGMAKLGRACIGFGSAFAFVGVLKIAADWLPKKWFGLIAGMTTALGMLGAIGGEMVLSDLIQWIGVRDTMSICIGIGAILTVLTWLVIRDPDTPLDQEKATFEDLWDDLTIVMRQRKLWITATYGLCLFMPTTVFAGLWCVKFLQEVYHMGAHAGLFSSIIFMGWAIGGPAVGLLESHLGRRRPIMAIGSFGALCVAISIIYMPNHSLHVLATLLFAFGLFSSVQILAFSINHDATPQRLSGTATALTNMVVMFGGFVQPVIGMMLEHHHGIQQMQLHQFDASDYQYALFIIPFSFFIAFIIGITHTE